MQRNIIICATNIFNYRVNANMDAVKVEYIETKSPISTQNSHFLRYIAAGIQDASKKAQKPSLASNQTIDAIKSAIAEP